MLIYLEKFLPLVIRAVSDQLRIHGHLPPTLHMGLRDGSWRSGEFPPELLASPSMKDVLMIAVRDLISQYRPVVAVLVMEAWSVDALPDGEILAAPAAEPRRKEVVVVIGETTEINRVWLGPILRNDLGAVTGVGPFESQQLVVAPTGMHRFFAPVPNEEMN